MTRLAIAASLLINGCGLGVVSDRPDEEVGDDACPGAFVERVDGTVIDPTGAPVGDAKVQLCVRRIDGELDCMDPASSDGSGTFRKSVSGETRCMDELAVRVLVPGERFATTYCEVPLSPVEGSLTVGEALTLQPLEPAATGEPGDASAARWVDLPGGLSIEVVPEELWDDYETLGAARVAPDAPCFARQVPDLLGLWALGPEGSTGDGGFAFRFREETGLSDGTEVELLLLGGLATQLADGTPVDEADFVPFATATVEGGYVQNEVGGELPYLSWLGYRVR